MLDRNTWNDLNSGLLENSYQQTIRLQIIYI